MPNQSTPLADAIPVCLVVVGFLCLLSLVVVTSKLLLLVAAVSLGAAYIAADTAADRRAI